MPYLDRTYRFLLNGVEVFPIIGNEFNFEWEKEDGSYFFRKKLSSNLKLANADYRGIDESLKTFRHEFIVQIYINGVWEEYYNSFFYKTDCEFDADREILTVKPKSDDGWEDLKKVLNNEYNLIELNPPVSPISIKLRPILQVLVINIKQRPTFPFDIIEVNNNDVIMNFVGTSYWEEQLESAIDLAVMANYNFFLEEIQIIENQNVLAYRYLTTLDTFGGTATADRLIDDPSSIVSFYNKTSQEVDETKFRDVRYLVTNPTKFGLARNCLNNQTKYFGDQQDNQNDRLSLPIIPSRWICNSFWWEPTSATNDYELTNSELIEIVDCYKIVDTIQLILSQETDIKHQETTNFSEFLYSIIDPVAGQKYIPIIAPKSNVRNAYYTEPARRANIRLNEILQMLAATFRVFWHVEKINGEKRLRLEHISWYENGGSYSSQVVDLDATKTFDKRNGLPLSFDQNKFKYEKSKMAQRYEFSYQDDVSDYFNGKPINIVTNEIQEGLIERIETKQFNPEFDPIIAKPDVALDGFVLFNAKLSGGDYIVRTSALQLFEGVYFQIQNASMSFQILHELYHRYGMPSKEIEINGKSTTALSIIRTKQQEFEFAYEGIEINPLHLITTGLGSGQVDSMSKNIVNNKFKITLNHDAD